MWNTASPAALAFPVAFSVVFNALATIIYPNPISGVISTYVNVASNAVLHVSLDDADRDGSPISEIYFGWLLVVHNTVYAVPIAIHLQYAPNELLGYLRP